MQDKLNKLKQIPGSEIVFDLFNSIFKSEVIQNRFENLIYLERKQKESGIKYIKDKSQDNWKVYASARGKFNSEKAAIKRMLFQRYKIVYIEEVISLNKIEPDYSLIQFLAKTIDGKILDKNSVKSMVEDRNFYKNNKVPYEILEENKIIFEAFKLNFHTGIILGQNSETAWIPYPRSINKKLFFKI
jgi:hypothetical protein